MQGLVGAIGSCIANGIAVFRDGGKASLGGRQGVWLSHVDVGLHLASEWEFGWAARAVSLG